MTGQFDASQLLGPGWFIMSDQAHYGFGARNASLATEIMEGAQMLAFYLPQNDVDVAPEVVVVEAFSAADNSSLPIVDMPAVLQALAWDANENDTIVSGNSFSSIIHTRAFAVCFCFVLRLFVRPIYDCVFERCECDGRCEWR
jgi:hypothetical protein